MDTVDLAVLGLLLRVSVSERRRRWLNCELIESGATPRVITYYPLWHMRHLILKWIVMFLGSSMQFPPIHLQNSVRVIFDSTVRVYVQAPRRFPKCIANLSTVPQISFQPMPHLTKSVIRWIAVRWLPKKATQIRITTDSSESVCLSVPPHCLTDNILLLSLFYHTILRQSGN